MFRGRRVAAAIAAAAVTAAVAPATSSADNLVNSKTIRWTENGRTYTLTARANYNAQYIGATTKVTGSGQAITNLPVQRVCVQHYWTIGYRRGSGTDRPFNNRESIDVDHYDTRLTSFGNNFFFRGPYKTTINNRNAGFGFTSSRALTWQAVSRRAHNAKVRVVASASSAARGCGRPLRQVYVDAD